MIVGLLAGFGTALHRTYVGETVIKEVDGKQTETVVKYETFKEKLKAFSDSGNRLTSAAFNSVSISYTDASGKTKTGAIGMCLDLIGIMALWLGMVKIAEKSGMLLVLARALRPLFRFLFPTVPIEHPASGAMLMTFAANMMGLDNAATPLAIKAMKELQTLNGDKTTASNAICLFVSLNLASMVIMPATIIGYRISNGSDRPMEFMVPMYIAACFGLATAFILCRILEKFTPDTPVVPLGEALRASEENK